MLQRYTEIYRDILQGYTGMYRDLLRFSGIYWNVPGCYLHIVFSIGVDVYTTGFSFSNREPGLYAIMLTGDDNRL
ncbi:MAG: hypothetical protein GX754_10620 [Clostridiaceae bacterium]|nr:hypothetical protein [Clostridiaceae bacterium]